MINADKFEQVFGIYATELWAKPEKEFLEWLNSEAQEVKDTSITSAERTGWTPCSEGLPKKYGEYLCCDIRGEYILGMPFEDEDSNTGFAVGTENEYMYDCIAWMPLPKAYKAK